jgi:hypothetical protein
LQQGRTGGEHDLQGLVDASGAFLDLILAQQLDDVEHGVAPSNAVAIKRLSARERERLRAAPEQVAQLDWLTQRRVVHGLKTRARQRSAHGASHGRRRQAFF